MVGLTTEKSTNIDKVDKRLGVILGTIIDLIRKRKKNPVHKIDMRWNFKDSEIVTWIKSGKSK